MSCPLIFVVLDADRTLENQFDSTFYSGGIEERQITQKEQGEEVSI